MLAHGKRAFAALREEFFELLLVKINDQHLDAGPEGLIVMLRHNFLVSEENNFQQSRHLIFH